MMNFMCSQLFSYSKNSLREHHSLGRAQSATPMAKEGSDHVSPFYVLTRGICLSRELEKPFEQNILFSVHRGGSVLVLIGPEDILSK